MTGQNLEDWPVFCGPLLSKDECKDILCASEDLLGWRIAGGSAKETRVCNFPDIDITARLGARVLSAMKKEWPSITTNIRFAEAAIVRYCKGAVVPLHTDINEAKRLRAFSFIIYLTAGYCGGELNLPSLRYCGVGNLGWVTVFPSTEAHWADEVTEGDKSVIVGFFEYITHK